MTYDQRPPNPDEPVEPAEPAEPVAPAEPVDQPNRSTKARRSSSPCRPRSRCSPLPLLRPPPTCRPPLRRPLRHRLPTCSRRPRTVNVADSGGYVAAAGPGPLYYARRVVSLLFGILITLLILRIVLLLLVADPGNSIVDFVYSVTEPFVAPFRGMFQFDAVASGDRTLDIAALVALIGWTLIYALIMAILRLADRSD